MLKCSGSSPSAARAYRAGRAARARAPARPAARRGARPARAPPSPRARRSPAASAGTPPALQQRRASAGSLALGAEAAVPARRRHCIVARVVDFSARQSPARVFTNRSPTEFGPFRYRVRALFGRTVTDHRQIFDQNGERKHDSVGLQM